MVGSWGTNPTKWDRIIIPKKERNIYEHTWSMSLLIIDHWIHSPEVCTPWTCWDLCNWIMSIEINEMRRYSDILSILSDILSGIYSDVLPGTRSLSGIYSQMHAPISFFLAIYLASILTFSLESVHSNWHILQYVQRSLWHMHYSGILSVTHSRFLHPPARTCLRSGWGISSWRGRGEGEGAEWVAPLLKI